MYTDVITDTSTSMLRCSTVLTQVRIEYILGHALVLCKYSKFVNTYRHQFLTYLTE